MTFLTGAQDIVSGQACQPARPHAHASAESCTACSRHTDKVLAAVPGRVHANLVILGSVHDNSA